MGQCNLGYCMLKGIGIRPDPAQAVYWFRKAAEGGSGRAMCLLGDCYREGQGVEADAAQARTCYQKAIDLGFDAKEELEELDKAAPARAAEQPKKKEVLPGPAVWKIGQNQSGAAGIACGPRLYDPRSGGAAASLSRCVRSRRRGSR